MTALSDCIITHIRTTSYIFKNTTIYFLNWQQTDNRFALSELKINAYITVPPYIKSAHYLPKPSKSITKTAAAYY